MVPPSNIAMWRVWTAFTSAPVIVIVVVATFLPSVISISCTWPIASKNNTGELPLFPTLVALLALSSNPVNVIRNASLGVGGTAVRCPLSSFSIDTGVSLQSIVAVPL
jgi:hypothetical protein